MTTTDHAAAFMAAVKGIPVHFVTKALRDFTTGTDWTRCPKTYIARCYADAKTNKSSHDARRFFQLTDLQALRQRALELRERARQYQKDKADSRERWVKSVQAERRNREALLADAARWRKLLHEVSHGRATVTPLEHASIAHAEGVITYIDSIKEA